MKGVKQRRICTTSGLSTELSFLGGASSSCWFDVLPWEPSLFDVRTIVRGGGCQRNLADRADDGIGPREKKEAGKSDCEPFVVFVLSIPQSEDMSFSYLTKSKHA